jgi:hypothetical protein
MTLIGNSLVATERLVGQRPLNQQRGGAWPSATVTRQRAVAAVS